MKTVCVYHSIDLDGWMSAAIVKYWYSIHQRELQDMEINAGLGIDDSDSIDFLGYNYGQSIPDLSAYDKVIMCDISFPAEEMNKLIKHPNNNNFIWCDHHISAISNPEINENWAKGLRDTTQAACELTWKYFFPDESMPEIVRLLGRYDCFGHKGTDEEKTVLEFQYGARQYISNYEEAYKYLIQSFNPLNPDIEDIQYAGAYIYEYLCTDAKQAYKNGFEINLSYPIKNTEVDINNIPGKNATAFEVQLVPFKFICINKERFNPINFGIDYHKDGYDGAACFHFDGKVYNFSLYNDNGLVDCSIIAKQFGGGGHKGAAGFRCHVNDFMHIVGFWKSGTAS